MKPRITTAREQFDMLSPWMITAAPPAFDKVYSDDGEFVRHERPQDFPSLTPPQEPEELAEPPTLAPRAKNPVQLKMFPNKDFKKVKPEKEELAEGWSKEKTKTDSGKNTNVFVSPKGNQYRVDDEGNPIAVTPADEIPKDLPDVSAKDRALPGFSANLGRFLLPDELERSIIEKYNASDEGTREAGSQWYDTANEYIHNLAQKAGIDPSKVGAIVSAFSPQTSWDQNMAAANYFIMNFDPENPDAINDKMGGLGENLERAKRIYSADGHEGYLEALQNGNDAHKITNFYHNLMGSKDHVTIDSWMARALLGEGAEGLADKSVQKVLNWKDGYDTMAGAVQSAAKKLGISPRELQAIVWSHVVPTAGSYEELTPQERAKKEQQRTKYIERSPDSKILPDYFHGPGWRAAPEPTYRNKKGQRFWQANQVLYRGIQLNPDAKPGEPGHISPKLQKLLGYGFPIDSDSVLQSIFDEQTGRYFTPSSSVAESFANSAPEGVPSAVMAVEWDGRGRSSRPHDHLDSFPDSWDVPTADPGPFKEVRLDPGKSLGLKSLRIKEDKGKPFREVPVDGPIEIRTGTRMWQKHAVEDWNAVEDHVRGQKYPGLTLRNELGDAPTSGYMVSLPGHEEVRPYNEEALARGDKNNVWTSDIPMSAETLKQFNTNKNTEIQSHPDNKQGGWEDDGDWFDDVSRHYTDIYDAAKQAYGETPEEAQHGFYDIKNEISPSPLEFMYKGEPAFFMARRLWKG